MLLLGIIKYIPMFPINSDLKDFLEMSAGELQKKFESSCGFFHTQQYLFCLMKEVTEKISALRLDAERLLGEAGT